jgi:uncharacterized protein YeaO (DUF488 family)
MASALDDAHPTRPRGEVHTGRWNDPPRPEDGTRILVCRYRPRGVPKARETWDEWCKELGPSAALHAAVYGKGQPAIDFTEYRRRYLAEMAEPRARFFIRALEERVAQGETLTLVCSSACKDPSRCHSTLLRALVLGDDPGGDDPDAVLREALDAYVASAPSRARLEAHLEATGRAAERVPIQRALDAVVKDVERFMHRLDSPFDEAQTDALVALLKSRHPWLDEAAARGLEGFMRWYAWHEGLA